MAILTLGGKTLDAAMENVGNVLYGMAESVTVSRGVECGKEALKGEEMKSLEDEIKERIGVERLLYQT